MSFRDHDKKTFIADTARDFAARRISKRDFLKKLGMAGVGLSAFSAGMLGNPRGFRGDTSLIGSEAFAQDANVTQWLKDVSGPFKGTKIRYTSEATPPTVVLDKLKGEFTDAADYRRNFPDGRIGSNPGLSTAEAGKRLFDAAVKDLAVDYKAFASS